MTISTWRSCITASAATAFAVGAFLGGCSTPATSSGSSAAGESCASQFDCASGLKCIADTCTTGAPSGTDGGTPDSAGDSMAPDVKTSDAKPSDAKPTPGSEGGADTGAESSVTTTSSAGLSALGQECASTNDCGTGLVCVPSTSLDVGICDLASFGIQPTGETCSGECNTSTDCVELPPNIGTVANIVAAGLTAPVVHTCADVLTYLPGGYVTNCTGATAPTATSNGTPTTVACFLYKTYCDAATSAALWTCEPSTSPAGNGNRCVFTGGCSQAVTDDFDGCPSETRFGTGLPAGESGICSVTTGSGKCTGPAGPAPTGCATNADCGTMGLATRDTGHICTTANECVCVVSTGACYVKCASTDDCAVDKVCSTTGATANLCVAAPGCVTNADCIESSHNATAICTTATGTCSIPCTNDHDCSNSSGATPQIISELGSFGGQVCDTATKTCTTAGCATNADCASEGVNGVNTFCVTPASPGSSSTAVFSAITN